MAAVAARFGEQDAEVLTHPVDGEAEVELPLGHRLPAVVHLPRLCRALGDDADDLLDVEASAVSEMDALGQALHQPRNADLVDHLGKLTGADAAHQPDHPGI